VSAALRLRNIFRRGRAAELARWQTYLRDVEPALATVPRVHRFAVPPVIGEPTLGAAPLPVWIEDPGQPGHSELLDRTLASIGRGAVGPLEILRGPLPEALTWTRAERVLLVQCGDELGPLALERLAQAAKLAPDAHVITSDEDRLAADRSRTDPHLRPGPSPDRWLACDDSGSTLLVSREAAIAEIADIPFAEGWRHELALRLAGGRGERHAHVPLLLCHRAHGASTGPPLEPDAITRVLRGFGQDGRAVASSAGHRHVQRPIRTEPSVEVIVCFRDRPELLERCIGSLLSLTKYEHLQVALVDNGSIQAETDELLRRLVADRRIRTLRDDRPFNFAALNNLAAGTSTADVLVFLNNDTEVIESAWLTTLLEEAVRPEVGAVAPMLLYPSGEVQHAGAALALHGFAGHPFAGLAPGQQTPFGCADGGTRNWMAVTAACLMLERAKFEAVGGFDETFVVAGNDVDLCLRLTAAGHRSLCVPHAVVLHDESRSRGAYIDPGDFLTSERRYGTFRTLGDPFYNPNLTLQRTDCTMRGPEEFTR
jgi:GT2 family glycosyltransferase